MGYVTGIESNGTEPKSRRKNEGRRNRTTTANRKRKSLAPTFRAANGVACNIWLTFKASNQILRIQSKDSWFSILNVRYVVATNEAKRRKKPYSAFDNVNTQTQTHTQSINEDGTMNDKQECQWHRFHYLIQIPVVLPGNVSLFLVLEKVKNSKA